MKTPPPSLFRPGISERASVHGPPASRHEAPCEWLGRRTCGLVVVGHGTADPTGAEETREVARLVARLLPDVAVELGFLEVIGPSIGEALVRLADRGCTEVVACPLLLFSAGHAKRDVPEAVRMGAANAGLAVRQADALGCHPGIVSLSRSRCLESVASLSLLPAEETVLLMIGRGSSEPTAWQQLHDFAVAVWATGQQIELGFVAAARPTLSEAIANAAAGGAVPHSAGDVAAEPVGKTFASGVCRGTVRRVIVQPHLLFRGHVEEQVNAAVDRGRREHPGIEWVQARRLGPDPLVARALIDRAAAEAAAFNAHME